MKRRFVCSGGITQIGWWGIGFGGGAGVGEGGLTNYCESALTRVPYLYTE
jgi:hypothetical protein